MKDREEKTWLQKIEQVGDLKTPFLLTDLDLIAEKARTFTALMPRVELYYAIKSDSDPRVIRTLNKLVTGFEVASAGEYRLLNGLGIAPERILYSNPVKIPAHIRETFKGGLRYYAFDSLAEIEKLKVEAPGANVYIRTKVSDYGSKFPLSGKFGVDPMHVLAYASAAQDAGLQVRGITFHVGSQSENAQVWEAAIARSGRLLAELKEAGFPADFLDIGGDFPANYEDLAMNIKQTANVINKAISKYIPEDVRIVAEPGRYISANASIMGTTVIGREHHNGVDWLYLDVGVFQGLMEPLEVSGWKYPIITRKSRRGYKKTFVLTGPTCDACDTLGVDYLLPSDLNVGDRIYIGAAGAYSTVYASNFNGFEPPKRVYCKKEKG